MDQLLINQKLESLRRCVMRLESRCPSSVEALEADLDAQDILALNLTRAVQLCVDIAAHWIAEHHELTSPITMGQSFDVLAERDVISRALADDMRKSVGFRNIVVHNYEAVNWQVVFAICRDHLDQFRQFARVFMDPSLR
ncbi:MULTISPECIES: type VII toxin-antitoxin system HepT family RNase toxin [Halomonadaceae]|jgi:uncharacterized protein YutE (UPF0331/DUF86 family)|uniref:DUF86 domain-containing protein n=1 Tax=Billgrantia aerodenitrificans TaxID=2733483 RepID=A0ABS9AUF3_9GAMM|nr:MULTISPECIES: DUF86 domain-containing protein [Halomonas]MCE8025296.1 DUF86 domain-containing protein [Halomonas aerodenitrificans]MCE8037456.1 DUF86 domain-containing protein [Halomonas sp. MCCC 1A11062]